MKRLVLAILATSVGLVPALASAGKAPGLKAQVASAARAKVAGLQVDARKISIGRSIAGSAIRPISGSGFVPGKGSGTGIGHLPPKMYSLGGFVSMQPGGAFKISVQVKQNLIQPLAQKK